MSRRVVFVLGLAGIMLLAFWLAPRGSSSQPIKNSDEEQAHISWHDLAGIDLPVSTTAGPHCLTPTRATCFAHTEQGAAFAAAHLLVRTFAFTSPNVFGPTITEQVVGADQPGMAQQTQALYAASAIDTGTKNNHPIRTTGTWLVGYRTTSSTEVQVLVRQDTVGDPDGDGTPRFTDFTVNLVWQQNDWRLIAPPWGDWARAAHEISNPTSQDWTPYGPLAQIAAA